MISVLVDLFREAGWIDREDGEEIRVPEERSCGVEEGQILFFRECLREVPAYLRGKASPIAFDEKNIAIWDRFLGCPSFRACRKLLMGLIGIENRPGFRVLDLCHGPGWGLLDVAASYPGASLTAIDFTDSFSRLARERMEGTAALGGNPPNIRWLDSGQWTGFGSPLPVEDGAFDAILFCCGDPYIPKASRREVYSDIYRALAPGGRLGIFTRAYPDAARLSVPSSNVRVATLVHDFLESVCVGWEGFSCMEADMAMFKEIGYRKWEGTRGRMKLLEGALWILAK